MENENKNQQEVERELKKKQATEDISKLLAEAELIVRKAEAIGDEFGIRFQFSVAYGMGGTYYPKYKRKEDSEWMRSNCYEDEDENENGWVSSSCW